MIKKWKVIIPPLTGKKKRYAYVYLPRSYRRNRRKCYPVSYMFDGHNLFYDEDATYGKSWGLGQYLDASGTEVIVAAIECNHSPDHGRLREYSPYDFYEEEIGLIEGCGEITMDWMINVFKPYIDKHFRTIPDREHTFIGGSSMGGLMSIFAVLHYNDVFSRAAALSPSLWLDPAKAEEMIRVANPAPDTVIYLDCGSAEIGNRIEQKTAFGEMALLLLKKGILLNARLVPDGEHSEASWEEQIPFFMKTLLYHLPKE